VNAPRPRFAGVELTEETIQRTRQWFADNAQACIREAESGRTRVNDLARYVAWRRERIADSLAGKSDHTFAFLQRAHWIQTGECVPLFAPPALTTAGSQGNQ
jgi:hypothetical protein